MVHQTLPRVLLALRLAPDEPPIPLCAGLCSIVSRADGLRLLPRLTPETAAALWTTEGGYQLRLHGGAARPIAPGDVFAVDGKPVAVVALDPSCLDSESTHRDRLRLVLLGGTVEVHAPRRDPVIIKHRPAEILEFLAEVPNHSAPWHVVASDVWRDESPPALRRRWDKTMSRLRLTLDHHGVRRDLITADGAGAVTLRLGRGDTIVQR